MISGLRQTQTISGLQRVLVVEDDAVARRAMGRLLTATGFVAHTVESAEAALAYLAENPEPCIALVDLDLPGMNGADLIRCLAKIYPGVVPVLITAAGPERLESIADRPRHYLRKPLDFQHLLDVISQRTLVFPDRA